MRNMKQDNGVTDRVQSWAQFVILAPKAIHCGEFYGMKYRLLETTNKHTHTHKCTTTGYGLCRWWAKVGRNTERRRRTDRQAKGQLLRFL